MGILSDIGDAFTGGLVSAWGASKQRKHARKEAKKMRDFQERMSNTAMQRRVEDLRAAGLNPILAATQGGASSPGGAMAPVNDPVGAGLSTARARLRERQEVRNMREAGKLTSAQEALTQWQKAVTRNNESATWHSARIIRNEADLSDKLKRLDTKIYSDKMGEILRRAQLMSSPVTSAAGAMKLFK